MNPSSTEKQHRLFLAQLLRFTPQSAPPEFLQRNRTRLHPALVELLYEEVIRRAHANLRQAERLAHWARCIAEELEDEASRAHGLRAMGHILYLRGEHPQALAAYQSALRIFRHLHREIDVGRTLNGAIQVLIYLGQYDRALKGVVRARKIFEKHKDRLRLARLDSNWGNILYRQDRFAEALKLYEQALKSLRGRGQPLDVAAVLSNMAVCSISLNDFARAERIYRQARSYCQQHRLPRLVAEADYNIAYLYYLRGEYSRALEMYRAARAHCAKVGDAYHEALCDLDQSEMSLELNLMEEGRQLAAQAYAGFRKLRMNYEAAKALTNLAIASSQENRVPQALRLFARARTLFLRERNFVWPALTDLYQALVLHQANRFADAEQLCLSALKFFSGSALIGKAALCELLLARLHLQGGQPQAALQACRAAQQRLRATETPALSYQAAFVQGQILEALSDRRGAIGAYSKAHAKLENLRSHIRAEELKIAFVKDKLAVYESLVWMRLSGRRSQRDFRQAYRYIEQAKSRSLAELIAFRAQTLPAPETTHPRQVEDVRRLRQELNWCYHQIDLLGLQRKDRASLAWEPLQRRTQEIETRLLKRFSTLRTTHQEFSSLQNAGAVRLQEIRRALPPNAMVLEYYQARGTLYAALVQPTHLEIVPVSPVARVRNLYRLLQFQLSKFRLGPEYVRAFAPALQAAAQTHLFELHQELLSPIRKNLKASHLIVIPHGFLHYLPFHALFDGSRYLLDDFSISYAPSASVYYLCCKKRLRTAPRSLVLGIPDPLAPQILDEVQSVASTLPHPQLFLGADATEHRLRTLGAKSRFVHIATHGLFRQDNPMFSSIRLGDTMLSLFDLYHLKLPAELVTLSGCATGSNVVIGGDELLGLVRGLLYAGAQSVLVTLWDVNDQSTAVFMKSFYQHLLATRQKAKALQHAMLDLRESYPHPYYWAPFALIGKVTPASSA